MRNMWFKGNLMEQPKNWEETKMVLTTYIKEEKRICKLTA